MTTHLDRFPVSTFIDKNPHYVDMEERDLSLDTAQVWTLHLLAGQTLDQVRDLAEHLASQEPVIVRDYTGGDSWDEWAEPYEEGRHSGRALHVYFRARNIDDARKTAARLLVHVDDHRDDWQLSTAGDWAEQHWRAPVAVDEWRVPITTVPDGGNPAYVKADVAERGEGMGARYFTLHLRCGDSLASVEDLAQAILGTGMEVLTGDYHGGDSFHEWYEPYDAQSSAANSQPGRALHVYLDAGNTGYAISASQALCERLAEAGFPQYLDPRNVTLSLAEDASEQEEVWTLASE